MFSKSVIRTKEIRTISILRCFSTATTLQPPPSNPYRPTRVLNENSEKALKDALRRITRVDNFIPITRLDVITALLNKEKFLSHHEQKKLSQLVGGMHQSLMQKMHGIHEKMKEKYDYLNPDKDTFATRNLSQQERLEQESTLLQDLSKILSLGNFREVPRNSLELLLRPHDTKGVKVQVNTKELTTCRVWVRGWAHEVLSDKSVGNLIRHKLSGWVGANRSSGENQDVTASRVVLAIRKGNERKLILKLFKDVDLMRIENLLPNGKVRMKDFDKKLQIGTISLGAITLLLKYFVIGSTPLGATWTLLIICSIVLSRTWFGYANKRNAYLVELMRTLYYNNLANNRGVLAYITDRAVDERLKQLVLAYCFLLCVPNRRGIMGTSHTPYPPQYYNRTKLKTTIEEWVFSVFKLKIDFEMDDTLKDLSDLGLLRHDEKDQLVVSSIEESLNILPKSIYEWSELDRSGLEI